VFRHAYDHSYLPVLEAMERFPDIKFVLHNSGPLLEWYEREAPDYLERVRSLVDRGQVEVLGGAFYEPIICSIPERDAIGQMHMMSDYVEDRFGRVPRGMWLAERVWEPRLAKTISEAGLEYLPLDDYEFRLAGIEDEDLVGPYIAEEQGFAVRVFPISKRLRYAIPFAEPEETLEALRGVSEGGGGRVVVFGDDGEKFGVWPGTYDHVHRNGWLSRFLQMLTDNRDWIRTVTFEDVIDEVRPLGRAYLPTSSYPEMMEWALPTPARRSYARLLKKLESEGTRDEWGPFLSGGTWKGFLSKYGESNLMVRKMMRVSEKIATACRTSEMLDTLEEHTVPATTADGCQSIVEPDVLDRARRELWMGQCNCAYWHGVFGGLYLPHLRTAIYDHLIRAERLVESARGGRWDHVEVVDHDLDGRDEVILESNAVNVYVAPSRGGSIFELDVRNVDWNALATMARHAEAYHDEIPDDSDEACGDGVRNIHDALVLKEKGLEKLAGLDGNPAAAAVDHFYPSGVTRSDVESGCGDVGDFAAGEYEFERGRRDDTIGVVMRRTGRVDAGGAPCAVRVEKRVWLTFAGGARVEYEITAIEAMNAVFGSEWNLSFLSPEKEWARIGADGGEESGLRKRRAFEDAELVTVDDRLRGHRVTVRCEPAPEVWTWPLDTASHSEGGLERVFQALTLVARWPLELAAGESRSFSVELAFSELEGR